MKVLPQNFFWPILSAILAILVLFLTVFMLCRSALENSMICSGSKTQLGQLLPILGVHLSPQKYIRIGSKYFSEVEGSLPFFVTVRGSDLIAFVTKAKSGRVLNIARPRTQEVVMSVPFRSYFGSLIGSASLEANEFDEAILLPSGTEVELKHSITSGTMHTIIDLKTHTVLREFHTPFSIE